MKKLPMIVILLLRTLTACAQDLDGGYLNRKTVTVGYGGIALRTAELNAALQEQGYPALPQILGVANVAVSTAFGRRWGGFYGVDFSTLQQASDSTRNIRFLLNRFYGGLQIPVYHEGILLLSGRVALSMSNLELHLYDTTADTSRLTQYLSGRADAKLVKANFFSIDLGLVAEMNVSDHIFLGARGGYIINPGSSNYRHDAGRFDSGPPVGLGSWYIGIQAGFCFTRRIMRVGSQSWFSAERKQRQEIQLPQAYL